MELTAFLRRSTPGPRQPALVLEPSLPVVHGVGASFPKSVTKRVLPLTRCCCMDGNPSWVRPKVQPLGKMIEGVVCDSLVGSAILVVC